MDVTFSPPHSMTTFGNFKATAFDVPEKLVLIMAKHTGTQPTGRPIAAPKACRFTSYRELGILDFANGRRNSRPYCYEKLLPKGLIA